MTNNHSATLAGQPRIQSGLEFVARFEANILLNGLVSPERSHRILLEVVRRLTQDRPRDLEACYERLQELQYFINADAPIRAHRPEDAPRYTPAELDLMFEAAKACITAAEPWHGPARWQQPGTPKTRRTADRRVPPGARSVHVVHGD